MNPPRKRRTPEHIRSDIAARYVEFVCAQAGYTTISAPPGADYGVDITVQTFDENGFIENEVIRLQVKAVAGVMFLADRRRLRFDVDRRDLHHWLQEIVPVILVVVDTTNLRAYWVYVQRYFQQVQNFDLNLVAQFKTIHLNKRDLLTPKALHRIARWKNQIVMQAAGRIRHD
jgi:hypothetical protein